MVIIIIIILSATVNVNVTVTAPATHFEYTVLMHYFFPHFASASFNK